MAYKKRILIVEDEETIAEMYKIKLEQSGFDVSIAVDGKQALELFKSGEAPDLILLDLMLPFINGIELLKMIKKDFNLGSKVIMFTNLNTRRYVQESIEIGADKYMLKANTTPKEILEAINELI